MVILGIVLLGAAVSLRNGLYTPEAVALALAGSALAVGAMLWREDNAGGRRGWIERKGKAKIATVAIGVNQWFLLTAPLLNDVKSPSYGWVPLGCWEVVIAGCIGAVWLPLRWSRWMLLGACLGVGTVGVWEIRENPRPGVDVYLFQEDACAAVMRGENPWGLRYPNPYSAEESWVYGPGVVGKDGRLDFGYPYLPVTLAAVLPGYAVLADYRYAMVLWMVVPVGLAGWRATRGAAVGLALLLTFPRLPMVIEWGWSEPVSVGLLVLAMRWRAVEWVGVMSKQYLLPLGAVLLRGAGVVPASEWKARAVSPKYVIPAAALLLTGGMVLWSPAAFWHSAMALQFRQPFRADSLSLAALVFDRTGWQFPALAALGITGALTLWMAWRRTRLVVACAVVLPVFFLLSKQAFLNYWFLVYAVWCLSLGSLGKEEYPRTQGEHGGRTGEER